MARWRRRLGLATAALALAAAAWAVFRRGREPDAAAPPVLVAVVAPRVHTLAEARDVSRRSGLPILLLLAPPRSHCPPARMLANTLFDEPGLARLSACAVPARLIVDTAALSPEAQAFVGRHAETVLPCLYVLGPDDDVLLRQVSRLYPPYDVEGCPLEGDWGPLLTLDDVCDLVDQAVGRERREDRLLAVPSERADVLAEQARILFRRERLDQARATARRAAAAPFDAASAPALARLLTRLGEPALAAHVLKSLWAAPGAAAQRRRFALALRRLEEPGARGARDPNEPPDLDTLQQDAAADRDLVLEALVRVEQGRRDLARASRFTAEGHVDWIAAHPAVLAGSGCETAELLSRVAGLARALGKTELAVRWSADLMRRFPDRSDVQELKHGNFDRLRSSRG
jgi:hypothetical protein